MLASVGGRSNVSKLYDTDLDDAAWAVVELSDERIVRAGFIA
jgi:hypothetical protein